MFVRVIFEHVNCSFKVASHWGSVNYPPVYHVDLVLTVVTHGEANGVKRWVLVGVI